MTWRLVHHFVDSPCERGARLTLGGVGGQGSCPHDEGLGVAAELGRAITTLLERRGIDYPTPLDNSLLWCLGGRDLYRDRSADGVEDLPADACVDLHMNVCDRHKAISIDLFPYDLVSESSGSDPGDPRRSEPVDLGNDQAGAIAAVVARLEPWLDEILLLPLSER